jgi:adenosylhomocysteine nucleosidase
MAPSSPALLVVTGLQREAQIAEGDRVVTLCSGGDPNQLRKRLGSFQFARPRETMATLRGVLSFGLAGGLGPHLRPGDVVLATHVTAGDAHYDASFDWHDAISSKLEGAVRLHRGLVAGMDHVLSKSADKAALHAVSNALAVDMESHIAADYALRHGLPFAVIRAISDPAGRSLPDIASNALTADGNIDLPKVIGGLLRRPDQLPALIAAGIDSERAFASLRRCRRLLGPLFGLGGANL